MNSQTTQYNPMETNAMESSKYNHDARNAGAQKSPAQGRCVRGITLIETVTLLAVIGIVSAIGMPALRSTILSSRATTTSNRLLADLSRARSEAVMSRMPSVVCPSSDSSTCNNGTDWSSGWIVFVDRDGDDQRSAAEPMLSAVSGSDVGGLRVLTTVGRTKARFLPDGRSGGTNLSMRVCDGPKLARSVIVNVSGRGRIMKPDATDTACE